MKNENKKLKYIKLNSLLKDCTFIDNFNNNLEMKNGKYNPVRTTPKKFIKNKNKDKSFHKKNKQLNINNKNSHTLHNEQHIIKNIYKSKSFSHNKSKKFINISLESPFVDKIKYLTKEENKKYSEINTYPFNFENLNLLNISKRDILNKPEDKKRKSHILIKGNFKKKIPIKYNFPKIEDDLIKIYKNIKCDIKVSDIIEYNTKNKSIFNSHFRKNIKKCTKYINESVNYLINKRIIELQKNKLEQTGGNTNHRGISHGEMKFNVLILNDHKKNINLYNYNPLNSYSIAQIKTEPNKYKVKNRIYKKFQIYKTKSKEEKIKSKKSLQHTGVFAKKNYSLENIIKEKSNNILFEHYSCLGEISDEIYEQNEKELKSYLNLIYLNTQLDNKINELNQTIKDSHNQIESNVREIKTKMIELVDNVNNIANLPNNLTDDIILHNCQKNFAKIKLITTFDKIKELKNNFEQNSLEARKDEIKAIKIKETYKTKISELKKEIESLKKDIKISKEAGIKYYLILLKEGRDNRNIGLTWIVKRLLRLEYTPKLKDFPEYINKKLYDYFIINAKNKNIILDCLQELGEIKNELKYERNNENKYNNEIDDLKKALNETHKICELDKNGNIKYNIKNDLLIKLDRLLEHFSFWTLSPEIKYKINSFCTDKTPKQYENNKIFNKKIMNKNQSFFDINIDENLYINDKEISIIINRVFELKNIIQNSYLILDNLKKKLIIYIKDLINNKNNNGIINENCFLIEEKIKKHSTKLKIIRNLIGNENKLKNINQLII